MVSEEDIIKFLTEHGEATLEEVSSMLKIPKYGPNSAYALLYSLKMKNVVERRGSRWALVEQEKTRELETKPPLAESMSSIKESMETLTRIIKESTVSQKTRAEEEIMLTRIEQQLKPEKKYEEIKTLLGLKTGTFLDDLFLGFNGEPLGGIPCSGQFMIVGPLGSGKSLLASEVSIRLASRGQRVLFIVLDDDWRTETSAFDLQSRMRFRANALNLNWNHIIENLNVLNPRSVDEGILEEYRDNISRSKPNLIILDPINRFGELGERKLINGIITEIININRSFSITGLFVMHTDVEGLRQDNLIEQIRYFIDGFISISPVQVVASGINVNVRGLRQLRIVQVTNCRICSFDDRGVLVNIMHNGLLQPINIERF
ncbi:MAG: ATPase domain-containing protein [Candidatus Bathyarchaeia archaeon]